MVELEKITDQIFEYPQSTYSFKVMSNIEGIDMVELEEKLMRSGAYSTLVPVVRSKVIKMVSF